MNLIEKYTPTTFDELIGNEKAKEALINWANGKKEKAMLVLGEIGVGKKTAINLLIKQFKFDATWINSDSLQTKNTDIIENIIPSFFAKNRIIVIDDIDNVKGLTVSNIYSLAKVPVIFLGNKTIGKLSKKKFESIIFGKILKKDLTSFISKIIKKEKIKITAKNIKEMIKYNGDLRNILYTISNGFSSETNKNIFLDNNTILKSLFQDHIPPEDIVLLINEHPIYIRLFIHENYLKQKISLDSSVKISDIFSYTDITELYENDTIIEHLINISMTKDKKTLAQSFSSPYINTMYSRSRNKANNIKEIKQAGFDISDLGCLEILSKANRTKIKII